MSITNTARTATARGTTPAGRIRSLGRAEFTLLLRNRTALAVAMLLPLAMILGLRPALSKIDFRGTGLNLDTMAVSSGIGFILLFVVYYNLVAAYVSRRQELVLKRLRTGEPTDLEILAGTAAPAVAVALAQCAILTVAAAALMPSGVPRRPDLLLAGVLLGAVLLAGMAAASTVFTRTVELAQITTSPLILVAVLGSGLAVPLSVLPEPLRRACLFLPLTPVMNLVRAGWSGTAGAGVWTVLGWLGLALVWTAVAVWTARRWFRWEPRR